MVTLTRVVLFEELGSDLGPITPKHRALSCCYKQEKARRLNKVSFRLQIRSLPLYPTELQARHQPKYYELRFRATPPALFLKVLCKCGEAIARAPAALRKLLIRPATQDLVGVHPDQEHLRW